jgi:hypothetical protein
MEINDTRTKQEKKNTIGYVVATDKFLSGWGKARGGSSVFALAITNPDHLDICMNRMKDHSDFKNVRFNLRSWRPKGEGHCRILGPEKTPIWYKG